MYTYEELVTWCLAVRPMPIPTYADGTPTPMDYHRLQIERLLWDNRDRLNMGGCIDIGGEWPRDYLPNCLLVNNVTDIELDFVSIKTDVVASITSLPFADNSIPATICTETLEHVPDIVKAVRELYRVTAPGGWVFASTPFLWPTHDTFYYGDYHRPTEQALRYYFRGFQQVDVTQLKLHRNSEFALTALMEKERMVIGHSPWSAMPSGYFTMARKAGG